MYFTAAPLSNYCSLDVYLTESYQLTNSAAKVTLGSTTLTEERELSQTDK